MRHPHWSPFIVLGLMIGFVLLIGLGVVVPALSGSVDAGRGPVLGNWWPGMWGMGPFMLVFPCAGFGIMMLVVLLFFSGMGRRGGPLMGQGGPMDWLPGSRQEDTGRSTPPSQTEEPLCSHCNSPVQSGWNVCPHCGARLT